MIESVKNNLIENGMQRRGPLSNDNYQVTVDADKQQMKISKRGQATIAMKASNLPTSMASSRKNPHHSSHSPKSTAGVHFPNEGKEIISDGEST